MAPSPSIKLTYFDLPAGAEPIRAIFRIGGVPFQDERLSREQFAQIKSTLPYGQLPILTVDGQVIAESQAILRYAGRITGMYPTSDPLAALMIDEVLTAISYLNETKVIPALRERDGAKMKQMQEALASGGLLTGLMQIEARLIRMAGCEFFRDSTQVYVHEVVLSTFVGILRSGLLTYVSPMFVDEFEIVMNIHEKIRRLPARENAFMNRLCDAPILSLPSLRVTYWDLKARGDIIRLALHIGGIEFEDDRITREQHALCKASLPYGQIPILNIDGAVFGQTFALACYAGTLSGLYPVKDLVQAARVDEIIARVETIHYKYQASYEEKDPEVKRAMREELLAQGVIHSVFAMLDHRVAEWKKTFLFVLGSQISLADLAIHHIMDFVKSGDFDYVPPATGDGFPTLSAIHQAVESHPRVVEWNSRRQAKTLRLQ